MARGRDEFLSRLEKRVARKKEVAKKRGRPIDPDKGPTASRQKKVVDAIEESALEFRKLVCVWWNKATYCKSVDKKTIPKRKRKIMDGQVGIHLKPSDCKENLPDDCVEVSVMLGRQLGYARMTIQWNLAGK